MSAAKLDHNEAASSLQHHVEAPTKGLLKNFLTMVDRAGGGKGAKKAQSEQARIVAPFDGVIVEGERRELLGSPVRRGDKVFRVAKVEGLYVTLYIPEADMRFITPESRGEISLLSQPDRNYPIQIEAVIPVAQVKPQAGNLFMVRARLLESPEAWWRPGMTGLARIDAGRQNILWLMTRRAIDALRLKLWW
jgi:multidrug resistance efflux pump